MKPPASAGIGRVLKKTPWEIAVQVANKEIKYGTIIENLEGGQVLAELKRAIFQAVRKAIVESSH